MHEQLEHLECLEIGEFELDPVSHPIGLVPVQLEHLQRPTPLPLLPSRVLILLLRGRINELPSTEIQETERFHPLFL